MAHIAGLAAKTRPSGAVWRTPSREFRNSARIASAAIRDPPRWGAAGFVVDMVVAAPSALVGSVKRNRLPPVGLGSTQMWPP
jgi:hypothetical protein